jgi:hypothetical protein
MDLNAYSVQEMKIAEMQNVDGGFWWIPALVGVLVGILLTQDLDALGVAFEEGYNSIDTVKAI